MPAILEVLLLLISFFVVDGQVTPTTGNNNADFATDSINLDMSKIYGNSSAPNPGPSYNITYPAGFVILKWEYYQNLSNLYIYIFPTR